ncbi:MAG: thiamine-phosphate kinase [Burkholderiaceae bacterium]
MTEFELIARYFDRPSAVSDAQTRLGIGDDCALLAPTAGHVLAVSTDMLVAGRHFFDDVDPASLGWKTLAVNLSDLAAMGARPLGFTLAVALPAIDERWLEGFSDGLFDCATTFACPLVGGDTTRGPLNLCVTVFGEVVEGRALRRGAAQVGDDVWVSGTLGGAALGLRRALERRDGRHGLPIDDPLQVALERPTPRIALGLALASIAHAAIDVSDGLAQDLGHVLRASGCAARLAIDDIPVAGALMDCDVDDRRRLAVTGGDDYELCFTAAPSRRDDVARAADASMTRVTRIGTITAGDGLTLLDAEGADWRPAALTGFDHFA